MDEEAETLRFGVELPGMLSWMIHGDASVPVPGLRAVPPEDRPPVNIVFQSYHLMVAIGMGLIGLSLIGLFYWWRGWLFQARWLLWVLVFSVLGPQLANQLGWMTAEIGRQPYIVQGLLRTADAFSPAVSAGQVLGSIVMFGMIYGLLFVLFVYLLNEKIQHGPDEADLQQEGRRA